MSAARMSAVGFAALVCGAATFALVLGSSHPDADAGWARLSPVVGLSFIATGLYAWRRRPDSRIGLLMVYMGFAWFLTALALVNSPPLYTLSLIVGGLWGGVFLHLVLSFPTGRLAPGWDRGLAIAGYLIFTARLGAGAAVRRPGRSRMRRVPGQRVSGTSRPGAGDARSRRSRPLSTRSCSSSCSSGSRCGGGAPARSSGSSSRPCTCAGCSRSWS